MKGRKRLLAGLFFVALLLYNGSGAKAESASAAILIEAETGRTVVFLNGGASEARDGRMGLINRDVLRWALGKELPQWK